MNLFQLCCSDWAIQPDQATSPGYSHARISKYSHVLDTLKFPSILIQRNAIFLIAVCGIHPNFFFFFLLDWSIVVCRWRGQYGSDSLSQKLYLCPDLLRFLHTCLFVCCCSQQCLEHSFKLTMMIHSWVMSSISVMQLWVNIGYAELANSSHAEMCSSY